MSVRQLEIVFGLLDRDGNSYLSLQELNRFMVALGLEPGTTVDFAAFCEQTGANADLGLSVNDFSTAYSETPGDKLDEILRVHGKEWQAAHQESAQLALPVIVSESGDGNGPFDASALYGIDEAVLLIILIVLVVSATLTWSRLRRCWRRCHSEEARQKRDAHRLSLIGNTARQISLDLDLKLGGILNRSTGFDDHSWQPNSNVGLGDINFTEMGEMVERLRRQGQQDLGDIETSSPRNEAVDSVGDSSRLDES
jgi:hypothetical protein